MNAGKTLFAQVMEFVPWKTFGRIIAKHKGGAMASTIEFLLQSHAGEIVLLPALPSAWHSGRVRGLRARGGFEVSMEWKGGALSKAEIASTRGTHCRVRYGEKTTELQLKPGETRRLGVDLGLLITKTKG